MDHANETDSDLNARTLNVVLSRVYEYQAVLNLDSGRKVLEEEQSKFLLGQKGRKKKHS